MVVGRSGHAHGYVASRLRRAEDQPGRGLAVSVGGVATSGTEHLLALSIVRLPPTLGFAGLVACQVTVADRPQVHQHDGRRLQSKTYGYYNCSFRDGAVSGARIRIYHRTAVRQQVIAPKVFLNTVLHEWMHHYDFAALELDRSPHTAGFYTRLRVLADELEVGFVLPPESEPLLSGWDATLNGRRLDSATAGPWPGPDRSGPGW